MLDVILLPAFDNMDAFVFCNQHQSVVLSGLIPQGFEGPGVDSLRFGSWARSASRNLPGKSSGCKPTLCSYRVRQVLGYLFFFFFWLPWVFVAACGPGYPMAGSKVVPYFLDQSSNLCPLHWKVDFQLLDHQGSPSSYF